MTETERKISPIETKVNPLEMRPCEDYVIVRHLSHQKKEGSLFIPETAQEKAHYSFGKGFAFRGVVVSVGPGSRYLDVLRDDGTGKGRKKWVKRVLEKRSAMETKPGDIVYFERRRESEVDYNGEIFSFLHEDQSILAIEEVPNAG